MTIHHRSAGSALEVPRLTAHLLDGIDDPFLARFSTTCPNVFLSRRFLRAVRTQILNPDERLILVGITDDVGMPFALFPFVQRQRLGANVIEGVDFGVADYFAPCLASDAAAGHDANQ